MNLLTLISIVLLITLFSVNVIAAREPFTPPKTEEIIENNVTPTISIAEEKSDIHYLSYPLQYVEAELLASQLSQNNPPLLSKKGKVFSDKQTNNLIFEDTQRHIERLQSWLKKLIYLNNKSKSQPILSIQVEKLCMSWVSVGNLVQIKSIK
ncbi:secretin N-terminal domain-containing protein [Arsenophonus endosymbiont of Aphis craccivora]|uniref:secretin N-terminal domain-containing protein n=1 Tax=Arsenophonus endosymbiont of Aphis craccivora TaxID=1231049 RepID=UPI001EE3454F|nr:secretin N-terminal domain-containing protein [Arsenophonus endosymbiont of Aphis craccivora]